MNVCFHWIRCLRQAGQIMAIGIGPSAAFAVDSALVYQVSTLTGIADGNVEPSVIGIHAPGGIAVDTTGNLYVSETDREMGLGNIIWKIASDRRVTAFAGAGGIGARRDGPGGSAGFFVPEGLAVDRENFVFVADSHNHSVRMISPDSMVTTLGGNFRYPTGVAVDRARNVYVADTYNHCIRKITPEGRIENLAGLEQSAGSRDGQGADARFNHPSAVSLNSSGILFVADSHAIRSITPSGEVTTLTSAHGGRGLAIDRLDNLYVTTGHAVRKISPSGTITTIAGMEGQAGNVDGRASNARFNFPMGVAVDKAGTVYVADMGNNRIRVVSPLSTVNSSANAQTYEFSVLAGAEQHSGHLDGNGSSARFFNPTGIAFDQAGNTYVADSINQTIRKISPTGVVTTLAGQPGARGWVDGRGNDARFYYPAALAVNAAGDVFVASYDDTIRKVSVLGDVATFAGRPWAAPFDSGAGSNERFHFSYNWPTDEGPIGMAFDASGNLYAVDPGNRSVRKITPDGVVSTLAGRADFMPPADGPNGEARFGLLSGITVTKQGDIYVADTTSIRRVRVDGSVSTVAGVLGQAGYVDGAGSAARFSFLTSIAADPNGDIHVTEYRSNRIRKMDSAGSVSTLRISIDSQLSPYQAVAFDHRGVLHAIQGHRILRASGGPLPQFTLQPVSHVVTAGGTVVLETMATGAVSYQWLRNGQPVAGATTPMFVLRNISADAAGSYQCVARNDSGTSTSATSNLIVVAHGEPAHLSNFSVRGRADSSQTLTLGITLAETSPSVPLLFRAVGPSLASFGVRDFATDPRLNLFHRGGLLAANDDWAGAPKLQMAASHAGAFPFSDPASLDAALVETLPAGSSTILVNATQPGAVLAEIYAGVDPTGKSARLPNFSARAELETGADVVSVGFVLRGNTSGTFLIRALGPSLSAMGVSAPATQTHLELLSDPLPPRQGYRFDGNPAIVDAARRVGAPPLDPAGIGDTMLLVTLSPGPHVATLRNTGSRRGTVVVEFYDIPGAAP